MRMGGASAPSRQLMPDRRNPGSSATRIAKGYLEPVASLKRFRNRHFGATASNVEAVSCKLSPSYCAVNSNARAGPCSPAFNLLVRRLGRCLLDRVFLAPRLPQL